MNRLKVCLQLISLCVMFQELWESQVQVRAQEQPVKNVVTVMLKFAVLLMIELFIVSFHDQLDVV